MESAAADIVLVQPLEDRYQVGDWRVDGTICSKSQL